MSDLNKIRQAQIEAAELAAISGGDIHQAQVEAGERAVIDSLPALLGVTREEFNRRMSAPYIWPTDENGRRYPQGDCSSCRETDKRHPEGRACDYGCVGV